MVKKSADSYNTISAGKSSTSKTISKGIKQTYKQLPSHIGIDKLHIRLPLYPDNTDGSHRMWGKESLRTGNNDYSVHKMRGQLKPKPRTSIYVSIFAYGEWAEIQYNPSRVLFPDDSALCPLEALEATLVWVLSELKDVITPRWAIDQTTGEILSQWPSNWYSQVSVSRIDFAADINVPFETFSVATMRQAVSNKRAKLITCENRGRCNTMYWGRSEWLRETFYDKAAHKEHKESTSQYRFEVQLGRKFIKQKGWGNLETLTPDRIMNLMEARWKKSRLETPFVIESNFEGFYERLVLKTSPSKALGILGALYALGKGAEITTSPKTMTEYSRISNELGFSLGDGLENLGSELLRMDLRLGRTVEG
jgi:hypothetical protein